MKKKTSFSLSQTAFDLLTLIARRLGLSRTAVIEFVVRDWARREGMAIKEVERDD